MSNADSDRQQWNDCVQELKTALGTVESHTFSYLDELHELLSPTIGAVQKLLAERIDYRTDPISAANNYLDALQKYSVKIETIKSELAHEFASLKYRIEVQQQMAAIRDESSEKKYSECLKDLMHTEKWYNFDHMYQNRELLETSLVMVKKARILTRNRQPIENVEELRALVRQLNEKFLKMKFIILYAFTMYANHLRQTDSHAIPSNIIKRGIIQVEYNPEELCELIETARVLFSNEGALIELTVPLVVVGDIHGQFVDLQRIFSAVGRPGKTRYLFLGDYVDRGPQSLECIASLVAWKIAYPKRVFLLRGNHEFASVNREYGFYEELASRFSVGQAMRLWKEFNDLFSILPFCALIKGRILCMHGGLSPHLDSLNDIRNIKMPIIDVYPDTLEQDLVWSDPKLEIKGFEPNKLRNISVAFGEDVVHKTCKKLGLDLIIRAHQVMENGYGFFAGRKLVTLFSAPLYSELTNKGAVMRISGEMVISYAILNPVSSSTAGADNFHRTFKDDQRSYRMVEEQAGPPPQVQ